MANKIHVIKHWMLGEAEVSPPVAVVNTDFVTWKPVESKPVERRTIAGFAIGRSARPVYSAQALHYSIMHPLVMAEADDLRGQAPRSSSAAHNRSLLHSYGVAEMASRLNVVDADGQPFGPIKVRDADTIDYEGLGLRIDTAGLRAQQVEYYKRLGHTLTWIGEAPEIKLPASSDYYFPSPEVTGKQQPSANVAA